MLKLPFIREVELDLDLFRSVSTNFYEFTLSVLGPHERKTPVRNLIRERNSLIYRAHVCQNYFALISFVDNKLVILNLFGWV